MSRIKNCNTRAILVFTTFVFLAFLAAFPWIRNGGIYTLHVYKKSMWICNSTNGSIAGPFEVVGIDDGVFALTGCNELKFGEVEFRDETFLPGRIRFAISGIVYDVMKGKVLVDGVKHEWNLPSCL